MSAQSIDVGVTKPVRLEGELAREYERGPFGRFEFRPVAIQSGNSVFG
jgi:hypothetical protein